MSRFLRQKTDCLSVAGSLTLCLAASLVILLAQPLPEAWAVSIEDAEPDSIGPVALLSTQTAYPSSDDFWYPVQGHTSMSVEPVALLSTDTTGNAQIPALQGAGTRSAGTDLRRPGSFVKEQVLEPVLGLVSQGLWLSSSTDLPDSGQSGGDWIPGHFRGVGFPDIRSHREIERYNSYDPEQPFNWNSMVAWREQNDDEQSREAIADVHCMGLSPQAVARRADRYEPLIHELADQYDISVNLIKAIVTKESCFDSDAVSRAGALGLMQLMPDTARWLNVQDPLDPEENLRAGVRYIASLKEQFGTLDLALAAYNAGPGNVRRYKGVPPFAETESYVLMVKAYYRRYVAATTLATR